LIADAEAQKTIKELFLRLAGNDLEVDAYALKDMLNAVFMKGTVVDRLISPKRSKTNRGCFYLSQKQATSFRRARIISSLFGTKTDHKNILSVV